MSQPFAGDQLSKEIHGALIAAIHDHGPITKDNIGSATKRVASAIRESLKRERDTIAASTPKKQENQ